MKLRFSTLFFFLIVCIGTVGYTQPPLRSKTQAPQLSPQVRVYSDYLKKIDKELASGKDFNLAQYEQFRADIIDSINALEAIKDDVQKKLQRSTGEIKESLEGQLTDVNAILERANTQLRIIDKEIIRYKAYRYIQVSAPLYKGETLINAYTGSFEGITKFSMQLINSVKNSIMLLIKHYIWLIVWAASVIVIGILAFWMRSKWGLTKEPTSLKFTSKIIAFIVSIITDALYPLIAFTCVGLFAYYRGAIDFTGKPLLIFTLGVWFVWLGIRINTALLYPKPFDWSIIHIEKKRAKNLSRRISLFIIFLAIRLWLDYVNYPIAFTQVLEFSAQVILSIQAFFILRATKIQRIYKAIIGFIAIAAPIVIFLGYNVLADLILSATLITIAICLLLRGFHFFIKKGLFILFKSEKIFAFKSDIGDKSNELMHYWTSVFFAIVLFFVGLYFALLAWGLDQTYLNSVVHRIFFGINLGGHTFSLINLLFAVIVFLFLFTLTRYTQSFLSKHIFPHTRFDTGLQHALKTTVGYIGIGITLIFTIKTIGLDFSSIVYVLGGLSVGIGLGLQPIVTNFISGLVMLVERPIKIGDCVEIGGEMGIVKRINVRTTEVETFEQSAVLFPNSQVVNSSLKNWTKESRMRRVEVPVGIPYSFDSKKAEEILIECLTSNKLILKNPAPYVAFLDFGNNSLNFSLRGYISDLSDILTVGTQLRHQVIERLRREGVEIPYPQCDVHFDKDFLEKFTPPNN